MSVANNLAGKTLSNRYEILRPLGGGGMGKVYLAKDKRFGKQVVVKVPTMEAGDKDFKDRFMREIASLATLEHAHIVPTIDWGEIEGIPFLVLRYLGGGSLRDRITDAQGYYKPMPLEGLNQWLPQIASALDFIHTKNWIHRDLKPDNILFDEAGNPYLADFGIAKALEGAPMGVKTTMGAFIGTPQYMAPEMHLGKGIGPRADQFGLAVLVYEALAGKIPFNGITPTAIFVEVMQGKARPIHELVPGIPLEKSNALMKGITKEPRERYGSCVEFANAILGLSSPEIELEKRVKGPAKVVIPKTKIETPKEVTIPGTKIEKPLAPNQEIARTRLEKAESRPEVRLRSENYSSKNGDLLAQLCRDLVESGKVTQELFLEVRKFCKNNDISELPGGVLLAEKIETIVKKRHVSIAASEEIVSLAKEILGLGKPLLTGTRVVGTSQPEQMEKAVDKGLMKETLENLGKGIKLEMALIPAGKFMTKSKPDEKRYDKYEDEYEYENYNNDLDEDVSLTEVIITKPYYMGKYEVTQEQWEAVMGNNPSSNKGAKFPVTDVSWDDCQEFIKKLNSMADGGYRLPTEAEWEYACRAGTTAEHSYGDNLTENDANTNGNTIKTVGSYKPNAFGLYDMHGNVWEWCEDWYGPYPLGSATDPKGPKTGDDRVLRNGSFFNMVEFGSSCRKRNTTNFRCYIYGFRLARAADIKLEIPAAVNLLVAPFTEAKAKESQEAIAKNLQKEVNEKVNLGNEVIVDLVLIPAGKFIMGSPVTEVGRVDNEAQHEVTITKPFYIGKYEVTQEQWQTVMEDNLSRTKGAWFPVTNVSWNECQEFIKKLNAKTNGGYRLPTEAEWEYACRAGTSTAYSFGDNLTKNNANINGSSIKGVGNYKPNAFGLYDMHGNVWEWCNDWYGSLQDGGVIDPKGPATGKDRVLRGGSFLNDGSLARSSFRNYLTPNVRVYNDGFRLARTADIKTAETLIPNPDPAAVTPVTVNLLTPFTEAEVKKVAKVESEKKIVHKRKKEKEGNNVGGNNDKIIPTYLYVVLIVTMVIVDLNLEKPMFFKFLKSHGIALGEKKNSTFQGTFPTQSAINKNSIKKNDIAQTIVAAAFIAAIEKDMILIPAGNFKLGSPASEKGRSIDEIQHEVTITKPFYMGKYEVTQEQWEAVMRDNPSRTKGDKLPVTNVSWIDCQEFKKKLNAKTSGGFRLPTEAEWEYACRAGTTTAYSFGDMITSEDSNYSESKIGKPVEVGSYKANAFGLFDMHANAWEWCEDWKTEYLVKDALGTVRVLRGGTFNYYGSFARSSSRYAIKPIYRGSDFGFRLARTP